MSKIKVDAAKEGECFSSSTTPGFNETVFVQLFCLQHLFTISGLLKFILHIIKRSGCNLQGHNMMEVNAELDALEMVFQ